LIALKNGKNYPAEWNDKQIKEALKTFADRIKKYKPGDSDYLTENLIDDAMKYNFGATELQNRKTNRFSWLVVLISIVYMGFFLAEWRPPWPSLCRCHKNSQQFQIHAYLQLWDHY
jgi:hypothetical protein